MELHKHGKIWAESEGEGFGCTFFVRLPLISGYYVAPTADSSMDVTSLTPNVTPMQIVEAFEEEQSEIDDHPVISPSSAQVQPVVTIVEATWKPTVLVVDDSAMNRKVDKFTFPSFFSQSLSQSLCPPQCIILFSFSQILHQSSRLTHNPPPPICQMLVRMLVSKGFACLEAEDGIEGLSEVSRMFLHKSTSDNSIMKRGDPINLPSCIIETARASSIRFSQRRLVTAQEHQEELEHLDHFAIDAVLIDSNMPRMNGPEAIVEMRKIGFRGPIIGVSGGDELTMKQFLKAGADNVMQKPAQSDKLVGLLLTGLDLVIQDATNRHNAQSLIGGNNGNNVRVSTNVWQHMKRLRTFIEKADVSTTK